jgi:FlaA1/EpsC-like NDP-sugar epimerase
MDKDNQSKQNKQNNKSKKRKFNLEHWMEISAFLVFYDVVAVTLAYFLALLIRFDFRFSMIPVVYFQSWMYFAPVYAAACIAVFSLLRLYRSIWRFASFTELVRIAIATLVTTIIHIIGITIIVNGLTSGTDYAVNRMPFSYYIMGAIIQFFLITSIRFSYRFVLLLKTLKHNESKNRIMLVGMYSKIGTS